MFRRPLIQTGSTARGARNAGPAFLRGQTFGLLDEARLDGRTHAACVVLEVFTDSCTCTVHTEHGELLTGVRFPEQNSVIPKRGARMVLTHKAGYPELERGIGDTVVGPPGEERVGRISPVPAGAADDAYAQPEAFGADKRGDAPRDILPGDDVRRGPDGQLMAMLSGGSAIMKASDLAQIIMTQARNLVRIVGNNVRVDTGMGTLEMRTEEGKSTLDLRIGADEATEGGVGAENWRIRAELGHAGEIADFRVLDTRGRAVYRHHVDPDGRVNRDARRETSFVDETRRAVIGEDDNLFVAGDVNQDLRGDVFVDVDGDHALKVGGNRSVVSGADMGIHSGHDLFMGAVRNGTLFTGGDATSGAPSFHLRAVNGDLLFDVGNPLNGNLSPSGIRMQTYTSDITLKAGVNRIMLNSVRPGGVGLGGPGPKIYHPVMYEFFASMLRVVGALIDTHIHPVPGGAVTGPSTSPVSPTIISMLPACKSRFVKLGG